METNEDKGIKKDNPEDEKGANKDKSAEHKGEDIPVPEGLFSEEELEDLPDYKNEEEKEVEHELGGKSTHEEVSSDVKGQPKDNPPKEPELKEMSEAEKTKQADLVRGIKTLVRGYRARANDYIIGFNQLFYKEIKENFAQLHAQQIQYNKDYLADLKKQKEALSNGSMEQKEGGATLPAEQAEAQKKVKLEGIVKQIEEGEKEIKNLQDIQSNQLTQFNNTLEKLRTNGSAGIRNELLEQIKNSSIIRVDAYNLHQPTSFKAQEGTAAKTDKVKASSDELEEITNFQRLEILSENLGKLEQVFELDYSDPFNKKAPTELPITQRQLERIFTQVSNTTREINDSLKNSSGAKKERLFRMGYMSVFATGAIAVLGTLALLTIPGVNVVAAPILAKIGFVASTSNLFTALAAALTTTAIGGAPSFFKESNKYQNLFKQQSDLCKHGTIIIKSIDKLDLKVNMEAEVKDYVEDIIQKVDKTLLTETQPQEPAASNAEEKSQKEGPVEVEEPKHEGSEVEEPGPGSAGPGKF